MLAILRRLSFHLTGAQLGITATSLALGFLARPIIAEALAPLLEPIVGAASTEGVSIALALALATVTQMVVGELIPKNLAIARPLPTARRLSRPVQAYGLVFGPLIGLLQGAANWTVRRLGIEPREELTAVRSLGELELLIHSSAEEGSLEREAVALLTRSIRFGEKTAADALVPRVALEAVRHDETVADVVARSIESGYSRYPVYGADLDDIRGVVHVKSIYRLAVAERAESPVAAIMDDPVVVPESRDLESLLVELRAAGSHMAVVVDEYGGTAGIVTLEDLLEEIVGEIDDEHDARPPELTVVVRPGTYDLAGSLHADEVLDSCGFELPEGDYETLAGFVLDRMGHLPVPGESIEYDGWAIEVRELDRRRISSVRLVAPSSVREERR